MLKILPDRLILLLLAFQLLSKVEVNSKKKNVLLHIAWPALGNQFVM